eukprot:899482-Prorocentrum_lima.AAC.1
MAQQNQRRIGGREMLLYVVRFYGAREERGQSYLFKDLLEVRLGKDESGAKIEPWLVTWQDVYHSMVEGPSPVLAASI